MGKWQQPVVGPITQRFGENALSYRPFGLQGHNGVDYGAAVGTPVRAAAAGEVTRAAMDGSGYGLHVRIQHAVEGYNGAMSLYAHLAELGVKVGQKVQAGQVIGLSGNTGNSTGPHLHFEVRMAGGPAGYGGAVDPLGLEGLDQGGQVADLPEQPQRALYQARVVSPVGVNLRAGPGTDQAITGGAVYKAEMAVYEERLERSGLWGRVGLGTWVCVQAADGTRLLERVEGEGAGQGAAPTWQEALDRWARGLGFDGPRPGKEV